MKLNNFDLLEYLDYCLPLSKHCEYNNKNEDNSPNILSERKVICRSIFFHINFLVIYKIKLIFIRTH